MPARSRVRDGRSYVYGDCVSEDEETVIATEQALVGKHETCSDVTGNWEGENNFTLVVQQGQKWLLEGLHTDSLTGGKRLYRSMPMSGTWVVPPHLPTDLLPALSSTELNNLAWEVLAATNPNVAHVSIPTFVGELKELPLLVKDWGGNLLRKAAKGHITWRWAIKPMINDLRKMINFTDASNQRIKELTHLRDGNELKRRKQLGSGHRNDPWVGVTLHSKSGKVINGRRRATHSAKQWGSVKWKLAPGTVLPKSDDELVRLARRLTAGITGHEALATAWELTPWSWFVDWFAGLGDVISACNNTVPLIHSSVCVMRTSDSRYEYRIDLPEWARLAKGEHFEARTRKERRIAIPIFPFQVNFPLLDAGKWSILGSLAVLKRR